MSSLYKKISIWFKSLFQKKVLKSVTKEEEEIIFLKMKIAEMESHIIQLGQLIQVTNESLSGVLKKANKSIELSNQHEAIFKKIIDDKLLVFGLTKNTKVIKEGDEPKSD